MRLRKGSQEGYWPASTQATKLLIMDGSDSIAVSRWVPALPRPAEPNMVRLASYEIPPILSPPPMPPDADPFPRMLRRVQRMPSRGPIYERPNYQPDANVFHDLVAYAPGLNTTTANVLAVLDVEAVPGAWNKPGKIDSAARTLLDKARLRGWHRADAARGGRPARVHRPVRRRRPLRL